MSADPSGKVTAQPQPQEITTGPRRRPRTGKVRRRKGDQNIIPAPAVQALDPSLYINRELSWLEFNQRVLNEARDARHPLLERVKFLAIVSSNLDEFFMIRVAAIKDQVLADVVEYSPDSQTPVQQMKAIHDRVSLMLNEMASCFWDELHPHLRESGVDILRMAEVSESDRTVLADLFAREIFPVLTPLAFDPGHPFPYISNLSLSLAIVVRTPGGEERFARVKVPDVLSRLVQIPDPEGDGRRFRFVWLEDLIATNIGMLFPGLSVTEVYAFRVTRNADIEIQEDEAEDLIRSIEESIRMRRYGAVVRVGVERSMPERITSILVENLEVTRDDVYHIRAPLGLSHLMALLRIPRPDLKDPVAHSAILHEEEGDDIFATIRRGDILLHHPYDSFAPVVQFIKAAANDPNVLAIKQTLYRIGKESPLIPAFIQAAENGKQVAVLVELKARFDEENNIGWAKQLERAGIHVVYGLVGLKTHAKMALVVRREQDGLKRYVHLGTGNYNPITARVYTDLSYFTCREEITADATEVFNFLTGYSERDAYRKLAVAPINLRESIAAMIDAEIALARQGRTARLVFKMNALTDEKMIEHVYRASQAGVQIDLIIRGICCLRPGVRGVSETIRVVSVTGRFLEHSRVFYRWNDGAPQMYLSSADLMGRNLDRRVELLFPIEDPSMIEFVKKEILDPPFAVHTRRWELGADGVYRLGAGAEKAELTDMQAIIVASRARSTILKLAVPREKPKDD